MKLKGIELNGTYKVEFYDEWFAVFDDERDNRIYYEDSGGYWSKSEYDERDNMIYFEDSEGYWSKREYDERGNMIYFENSRKVNGKIANKYLINIKEQLDDEIKEQEDE